MWPELRTTIVYFYYWSFSPYCHVFPLPPCSCDFTIMSQTILLNSHSPCFIPKMAWYSWIWYLWVLSKFLGTVLHVRERRHSDLLLIMLSTKRKREENWAKEIVSWELFIWASLVVQWLRIPLPMQGTWVQPLVQEDSMCHGATKPVCHNFWAHML